MNNNQDYIKSLEEKLELLLSKQEGFAKELMDVYKEIESLKKGNFPKTENSTSKTSPSENIIVEPTTTLSHKQETKATVENEVSQVTSPVKPLTETINTTAKTPKEKSNIEKFIGENLINKIGILITVIGVVIGAKYSIENNLISPLTRIILGYLTGLALLGFGIKLKAKYENYSAVLVSGAIAILYFITFAAYSLYSLFPQIVAFIFMLIFTVFAVIASLNYNKQIIAHIGLVGAYAIPFLLSTGSGDVLTLFSYMTLINIGILILSFKKYWKPLYYVSFAFTWLIYFSWLTTSYSQEAHFNIALLFLTVFFLIFYFAFMGYKLIKKEQFNTSDVVLLFFNSFIFYGLGYYVLEAHSTGNQLLGLFTLSNAVLHFIIAAVVFKQKLADQKLFYLISVLVLTFLTITIPVQLDGNWVTLLWAVEAALLSWVGITKKIGIYKKFGYLLMTLAFFSIFQDWSQSNTYSYDTSNTFTPIININFLSAVLVSICFGFITWLNYNKNDDNENKSSNSLEHLMSILIPVVFLITSYFTFFTEINMYWEQLFNNSKVSSVANDGYDMSNYNFSLLDFKNIWLLNYSLLFFSVLSFINIKKIKNYTLGITNLAINILLVFAFLIFGLYVLSELRSTYIEQTYAEYYNSGIYNLGIRYISFLFLGLILFAVKKYTEAAFMKNNLSKFFEILLHITVIWVLSSELLHWMDIAGFGDSYKMNLSILWGTYSLLLIILGIWKRKKQLRIGGIALFGLTLVKLFFYDIADLDTISKTIVFVSLGLLLLVISFLYNKYTKQIEHESKDE